jgi:radical SAM superfamily enzyme YgiQ (UPF0313 family)
MLNDPRFLLLYPRNQTIKGYMCKPNGSLAYPNIGGALLSRGVEVRVFDACVGNEKDDLQEVFYHSTELPSGLLRSGVSDDRIVEEASRADVIGITSIFTSQETMVLDAAQLIKAQYREKLVIAGGVNARHRLHRFLTGGVDLVFLSEAELSVMQLADALRRGDDWRSLAGIAFLDNGKIIVNPVTPETLVTDLDALPLPAWHLLPNDRYWTIGRPHGGHFEPGTPLRYASMMTSMGCVFSCSYCHISKEKDAEVSGNIGRFRIKSDQRVAEELRILKALGVKQVFVEDDTLFGMKRRGIELLRTIRGHGLEVLDVNGVNVTHLFRKAGGTFVPDEDVIQALVEAGFREVVLGFESGSQRIIQKYASNKWRVEALDIGRLLKECKERGLTVSGNYMLGYPDETSEEFERTIAMASRHRALGLDWANFLCVMPLPGTVIFEWAIRDGHLPADFNPDLMNWTRATMTNTPVPAEEIERRRLEAWTQLNDAAMVAQRNAMNVAL